MTQEDLDRPGATTDMETAIDNAVITAGRWAERSKAYSETPTAKLLADVLKHPDGLVFTVEFVDGVIRPEDEKVAAGNLAKLMKNPPSFLPAWLRIPASVGGTVSKKLPGLVVAAARRVFAGLVGDLVLDVGDRKLASAIERLRSSGARLNINLLGEAVLGNAEADRRLQDTFELLKRSDVDYVSLKVSAVVGPHSEWSHAEVVQTAVERLLPLYQYAASSPDAKFINLDMEEYRDLDLTLDVFKTLMDFPGLIGLDMGIVIQAYLPDALGAMEKLQSWAKARRSKGGAPIKVRLVKGATLAMERVQSELHGWPVATWDSKQSTDANYLRLLDWALTPERTANVRIGVAGHNLFSLATAWELAGLRGVRESIDIEMLSGMAVPQAKAVTEEVGPLLYYVPVVRPSEFDVAIAYLVRRLEENSDSANFMASIFDFAVSEDAFLKEKQRFLNAAEEMRQTGTSVCTPKRRQNRLTEGRDDFEDTQKDSQGRWRFSNTPDTDPSLEGNRKWATAISENIITSTAGEETAAAHRLSSEEQVDQVLSKAQRASEEWRKKSAAERAEILHNVGFELARRRADLLEVAASELGKTLDQSDPEVSEAIDFAHYYGQCARELETIPGATFKPAEVTLVTPPWNFPLAIPMGGIAAALAAGSTVVFKPASAAQRCGALLAECLWAAGVDPDVMQLVVPDDSSLGKALVEDPRVGNIVLTGSSETAQKFLQWRPDVNLLAETSGKNAIIVTPSADLDLAVKDVVYSAFGHAGQKCSAASLVILVGSVGTSQRFHRQLIDATQSLTVDWPLNPMAEVGPLSVPPGDKLMRGLTTLEPGQKWALAPRRLDATNRLWSPGVRSGVVPGSEFHTVEYFGPLLGVMRAETLEEAIEIQNGTEFGLTAGLHSLDTEEIQLWLDHIHAGNVYVNRTITGAIVRRQPFGGWKLSAVGSGAKAGGPNYLLGFGDIEQSTQVNNNDIANVPITKPQLRELGQLAQQLLGTEDASRVLTALRYTQKACDEHFDRLNDPSGLRCERNVLRYVPTAATIRASEQASLCDVMLTVAYALAVGEFVQGEGSDYKRRLAPGQSTVDGRLSPHVVLSSARSIPSAFTQWANRYECVCIEEDDEAFVRGLSHQDNDARIRLVGAQRQGLDREVTSSINLAVWDGPVTTAARVEILPFVHEQAVSITMHRFGTPSAATQGVMEEAFS